MDHVFRGTQVALQLLRASHACVGIRLQHADKLLLLVHALLELLGTSLTGGDPRHVLGALGTGLLQSVRPLQQLGTNGGQFGFDLLGALTLRRGRRFEFLATALCRTSRSVALRAVFGRRGQLRFERVHTRDERRALRNHPCQLNLPLCERRILLDPCRLESADVLIARRQRLGQRVDAPFQLIARAGCFAQRSVALRDRRAQTSDFLFELGDPTCPVAQAGLQIAHTGLGGGELPVESAETRVALVNLLVQRRSQVLENASPPFHRLQRLEVGRGQLMCGGEIPLHESQRLVTQRELLLELRVVRA